MAETLEELTHRLAGEAAFGILDPQPTFEQSLRMPYFARICEVVRLAMAEGLKVSAPLTKETLTVWDAALRKEGMRGCYDGDEAAVFFEAGEWLARAANKLRPQESANEPQ